MVALSALTLDSNTAGNWPEFRGPDGRGRTDTADLPLVWGEDLNVRWKSAIHGRGWSSPVVWDAQIWITTATEDGRRLSALCADRDSGRILRDLPLFDVAQPQEIHRFNSYASPTPAIEAGRVYVTFGSPGTACIDTATGAVLWERRDLPCNHFRGSGASPILHRDRVILPFDGSDTQYLVALDKATGRTVWRTERSVDYQDLDSTGKPDREGDRRKAFATPQVALLGGAEILLSPGSMAFYAYDPGTGRELWRVEDRGSYSGVTRPVVGRDLIYATSGMGKGGLMAIRPGGSGVVTGTHVVWRMARYAPKKPSPLLDGDLLFTIEDTGMASCLDARSGDLLWQRRISGNYSASPLGAPGRVYLFSEEGRAIVLRAAREFEQLAENRLGDGFLASPAVVGRALILRDRTHLYRIEEPFPAP